MKKNILIVSRSFYPMNSPRSFRTTELVKEFARQGHQVTLFTVKDDEYHVPFEREYGVIIKDLGPLKLPKINLNGTSGFQRLGKRFIRRVLYQLFEYPDIELMYRVKKALVSEEGYDLLISIAAPHPIHWGVAWAWRDQNPIAKIWVADCGDPYYGLENDSFKKLFYFSKFEKWFCQKADYITIPFEGGQSAYFEEFHSKIRIIPQGLSFPEAYSKNNSQDNDVITFAYFGNIQSYMHYAKPFLEKLNSIDQEFRFIVYTKNESFFEKALNKKTLSKCVLKGYVERERLLQQLSYVDFLIYFPYVKNTQKSLKLVDYNFLKKPILEYMNDEASDRIFKEFLEYDFSNRKKLEDYNKYKIENVCSQFLDLANKKINKSSRFKLLLNN